MEWEESLESDLKELEFRIKGQMERFLKCRELKTGDACWDTDIRAGIFGKNWRPNRQQGLEYQKSVVRRVKQGMVCGREHMFYVSVTQDGPKGEAREDDETYFDATRKSENELDFVIPKNVRVAVQIRTLCRFSTPELELYDADEEGRHRPCVLIGEKSHRFVLEIDKTKTLGGCEVENDRENEVYIV